PRARPRSASPSVRDRPRDGADGAPGPPAPPAPRRGPGARERGEPRARGEGPRPRGGDGVEPAERGRRRRGTEGDRRRGRRPRDRRHGARPRDRPGAPRGPRRWDSRPPRGPGGGRAARRGPERVRDPGGLPDPEQCGHGDRDPAGSEERRVGKEWRWRWAAER